MPFGKFQVTGDLANHTVRCHQDDHAGLGSLTGEEFEADARDVGIATTIDHDVVPAQLADTA